MLIETKILKILYSHENKLLVLSFLLFLIIPQTGFTQIRNKSEATLNMTIPPIALLDVSTSGVRTVTFRYSPNDPNQVEQVITPSTGNDSWLNYSSIVNDGVTNYITAEISTGILPPDVSLDLFIGEDIGGGAGNSGVSKGAITLSGIPQVIISSIGSCFTGKGLKKGHQLKFIWKNPEGYNYSLNYNNNTAISVTYTISSTE